MPIYEMLTVLTVCSKSIVQSIKNKINFRNYFRVYGRFLGPRG